MLAAKLDPGASLSHEFKLGHGWLQVARGSVDVSGKTLKAGDGLAFSDEDSVTIASKDGGEVLLFDLA